MTKQIQDAYIVAAVRTPVGKAPRGMFRNVRPDDMLAHVLRAAIARVPGLDPHDIADVIVGCAMPEGEQGMNVARIGVLLAGLPDTVPAMTINRFCSSGVQAVALAADRIRTGDDDVVIAAGTESMSMVPMMGNKIALNDAVFQGNEHVAIAYGMGITAENVAKQWKVTREEQEAFAVASHQKASKVLAASGVKLDQLDWIELNEAFAAQSLAVIKDLGIDPEKVNPQGGAIALGHPLGATGAIRTATLVHGMKRTGAKYGMVTMCIGTGMGAAGPF